MMRYIVIGICTLVILVIGLGELNAVNDKENLSSVSGVLSEYSCSKKRKGSLFAFKLKQRETTYYRETTESGLSCNDMSKIISDPSEGKKIDLSVFNGDIIYEMVLDGVEVFNYQELRDEERSNSLGLMGFALFIIFILSLDILRNKIKGT